MRILFFTDHFKPEPSAPAAHVYDRARLWVKAGHEVTVICSAPNFPEGRVYSGYKNRLRFVENLDGIRVVRVKTFITKNEGFILRTLDYISYMVSAFFMAFFEKRPDVVISTSPHLFTPISAVAHCFFRRLPHVLEVRDLWPASILATGAMKPGMTYRFFEWIELKLYKRSRRIICLSPAYVEDLTSRGIPADKLNVVLAGADLEVFSPRDPDAAIRQRLGLENKLVIGYLGTLGMAHGLENVIETAKLLRNDPVVFLFVGAGAAREMLEQSKKTHQLDNVVIEPRQLKEDMPKYWSVTDIGLIHLKDSPLFSKVVPTKIFESMAMGKPILYAGCPGQGSAIVEKHKAGWIVTPMQPQALTDAIRGILKDPESRATKAEHSRNAASAFSRETQARESLAILEAATAKRPA